MNSRIIYSRVKQVALDAILVAVAFLLAYWIRFDGTPRWDGVLQAFSLLPFYSCLYVFMNFAWGVYSFVWRFISFREVLVIAQAGACAAVAPMIVRLFLENPVGDGHTPFGVLLIHPLLAVSGMVGLRMLRRWLFRFQSANGNHAEATDASSKRLLLVGAGDTGFLLAKELEGRDDLFVVGFVDDDALKQKRTINGTPVLGEIAAIPAILHRERIDEVVICLADAPRRLVQQVATWCSVASVGTSTIPNLGDVLTGRAGIGALRPVRMEELLGRESVRMVFDEDVVSRFRGKCILVTGAGGSIGSEICGQLMLMLPSHLVICDKDENALYEVGLEISEEFDGRLSQVIGDIRDRVRMADVFRRYQPEVVFHAAAYKHVPMMESNPCEALLTNVFGTRNMVELSLAEGVETFVLISTDKAVNATSIMGASKRIAEWIVQSFAPAASRYCCVRFGNVLGSRASVVPVFQKRIAQRKSLHVTHPEIRRYFMTISEAVQLVIQAGSMGRDREVFYLDMGEPVKIATLARELIKLSGLVPDQDVRIEFTGLRPGEKLFEELLDNAENGRRSTRHPKIFVATTSAPRVQDLALRLRELEEASLAQDEERIRPLLELLQIGYRNSPPVPMAEHGNGIAEPAASAGPDSAAADESESGLRLGSPRQPAPAPLGG